MLTRDLVFWPPFALRTSQKPEACGSGCLGGGRPDLSQLLGPDRWLRCGAGRRLDRFLRRVSLPAEHRLAPWLTAAVLLATADTRRGAEEILQGVS
jgi:hypothetical protein